jgi:hypothetical protein
MEIELDYEEIDKIVNQVLEKLLEVTNLKEEMSRYLNDEARRKVNAWICNLLKDQEHDQLKSEIRYLFRQEFNGINELKRSHEELYKAYLDLDNKYQNILLKLEHKNKNEKISEREWNKK